MRAGVCVSIRVRSGPGCCILTGAPGIAACAWHRANVPFLVIAKNAPGYRKDRTAVGRVRYAMARAFKHTGENTGGVLGCAVIEAEDDTGVWQRIPGEDVRSGDGAGCDTPRGLLSDLCSASFVLLRLNGQRR